MTLIELLTHEIERLHALLDAAVTGLTPEQWHRLPAGNQRANTIAFELWHYARTEDNVVQFILQNRRPTVWMEGGWPERLGLPPVAQGTGMPAAEAQALRIGDLDAFVEYVRQVWKSTDAYLGEVQPDDLSRTVLVRPLGEMPAALALGQVCVSHGFSHYGEIELCRTLMGLESAGGL
jgi:DinB superfamily